MNLKKLVVSIFWRITTLLCVFYIRSKGGNVGENVKFNGMPRIKINGDLKIGDNCVFNCSRYANPIAGEKKTFIKVGYGASLKIGNNVGLSNVTIFCEDNISIGDYTLIGGGVSIYDTDFHSLNYKERRSGAEIIGKKAVMIKNDVFIGTNSLILKNTLIGQGTIIGAASVIASKQIGDFEVWAGNPVQKIRNCNENLGCLYKS